MSGEHSGTGSTRSMRWLGGCQCGAARYSVDPEQIRTLCCCHCRDCQKQSGSAFGMSLILPRRAFALEQGELAVWSHRSARGSAKHAHFCPLCGGRIFNDAGAARLLVRVKAGTHDETADLERKRAVVGKRVSVSVGLGGRRSSTKKPTIH